MPLSFLSLLLSSRLYLDLSLGFYLAYGCLLEVNGNFFYSLLLSSLQNLDLSFGFYLANGRILEVSSNFFYSLLFNLLLDFRSLNLFELLLLLRLFSGRLLRDFVFVFDSLRLYNAVVLPGASVRCHTERLLISSSAGAGTTEEDR